jgi:beta-lactamase regulating signal transducer with metallopeptidase domain
MNAINDLLASPLSVRLGWTLLHFLWQGAAAALLLAIALLALRRSAANAKYLAACTSLSLMAIAPLLTFALLDNLAPPPPPVDPFNDFTDQSSPDFANAPPLRESRVVPDPGLLSNAQPLQTAEQIPPPPPTLKQRLEPHLPAAVTLWAIGVTALSLRLFAGWLVVQRLRRRFTAPVTDVLQNTFNQLRTRLKIARPVQLLESAIAQVPATIGWIRPILLLPAAAMTRLTPDQLEAVLAHELAHVKRFDYLVNLAQSLIETLGFYHPAVWWVSARIRAERENACDDLAVALTNDPIRYAKALSALEHLRGQSPALAAAATGGSLLARIRRLTVAHQNANDQSSKGLASILAFGIILGLAVSLNFAAGEKEDGQTNDVDSSQTETLPITEVYRLQHQPKNARQIADRLKTNQTKPFLEGENSPETKTTPLTHPETLRVAPVPERNGIVITGLPQDVEIIKNWIKSLDVPLSETEQKLITTWNWSSFLTVGTITFEPYGTYRYEYLAPKEKPITGKWRIENQTELIYETPQPNNAPAKTTRWQIESITDKELKLKPLDASLPKKTITYTRTSNADPKKQNADLPKRWRIDEG